MNDVLHATAMDVNYFTYQNLTSVVHYSNQKKACISLVYINCARGEAEQLFLNVIALPQVMVESRSISQINFDF